MNANTRHLGAGILLALPFFIANALVVTDARWFLELIRPEATTNGGEQILILFLIALVFVGGMTAFWPVVSKRKFFVLNAVFGAALIVFSVVAGWGLAVDFYQCDILGIPNCD